MPKNKELEAWLRFTKIKAARIKEFLHLPEQAGMPDTNSQMTGSLANV